MADLRTENELDESIKSIEQYITFISVSNFKTNVPKVNFKKIKLNRFQNLYSTFKSKSVARVYLDERLLELNLPARKTVSESSVYETSINPLRKKKVDDEKPPLIETEVNIEEPLSPEQGQIGDNQSDDLSNNLEESGEELKEELEEKLKEESENKEPVLKLKSPETIPEATKDITFNLEAQIVQEDENILLSPTFPSAPKIKEDLISSSGEQPIFAWPPVSEKKVIKTPKSKTSKKKPYFFSDEDKSSKEQEKEKSKVEESKIEEPKIEEPKIEEPKAEEARIVELKAEASKIEPDVEKSKATDETKSGNAFNFPWTLSQSDNLHVEEVFGGGGLESELLDIPVEVPESPVMKEEKELGQEIEISNIQNQDVQGLPFEEKLKNEPKETEKIPFAEKVIYKALSPNVLFEPLSENVANDTLKNVGWFNRLIDKFNNLEFGIVVNGKSEKKVGKMFGKNGYKLTPIRIIILGGAVATLGYSVWNYLLPIINSYYDNSQVDSNSKVVVRNLFKTKSTDADNETLTGEKTEKLKVAENLTGKTFSPITEEERQTLIQMARESLESRLDPFGQEEVLPRAVVQQKIDEQKDTGPREIPVSRTQVELVGVISANNKDLALVNVYNADYTIIEGDDKTARDGKLKTALSMAVPNRLEVSLLDPVDEWYVKQIIKGKVRGDDPMVELVKDDKKFKLKVGQKVLLPEEKPLEEPKTESKEEVDLLKE